MQPHIFCIHVWRLWPRGKPSDCGSSDPGSSPGENQDRRSPWEWAFFIDYHTLTALRCKMSTWHIGSERCIDCRLLE